MYLSDKLFQRSWECYFGAFFPELQSSEGNKHKNNTWVSAETVCHEIIYFILLLTRHNKSIDDDKNNHL